MNVERLGNTDEHIDADVSRSRLDFPEVGAARARHERKLSLRHAHRVRSARIRAPKARFSSALSMPERIEAVPLDHASIESQ